MHHLTHSELLAKNTLPMKIKTGDNVKVISGRDTVKGKTGKVIQVLHNKEKAQSYVVIEALNMRKKHIRGGQNKKGQTIELPAPIHISNVMLIDPSSKKPTRVGYTGTGKDKKRVAKKTGESID